MLRRRGLLTLPMLGVTQAKADAPLDALAGYAMAAWRGGQAPRRWLQGHAGAPGRSPLVTADTLWRVASISKLAQALAALRLHAQGRLDLDAPLPWRHPRGGALTPRNLLSHQSGLRDNADDGAQLPRGPINDALLAPLWGERRFAYANVNSVLLGTWLERLSGLRHDALLQQQLFAPLGMEAAFDLQQFSAAQRQRVATLQRRVNGQWRDQTPDLRSSSPPRRVPSGYPPGVNALPLAPQGGLHTSLAGLERLAEALRAQDPALLPPSHHALLAESQWQQQGSDLRFTDGGLFRSWGLGAQRFTDTAGGDRLHARGNSSGFTAIGHLGSAYGLLGGLIVQPQQGGKPGWAVVYLLHGTPPEPEPGRYSAFSRAEEALLTKAFDTLLP